MTASQESTLKDGERWTVLHGDCNDLLPGIGAVDAVVTDPPYGILNLEGEGSTSAIRKSPRQQGSGTLKNRILNVSNVMWDRAPGAETFAALRAMSKHQVFWGGNYFPLPPTRCVLVWDKEQPWPNFSQAEIAWTNIGRPAAIFRRSSGQTPNKVHPTQKPVELMRWCLGFLPDAALVLDPFCGSGSTGVAAVLEGRRFIGIEREAQYVEIARRRIADAAAQGNLFGTGAA
jgi:site-specific DNA-methyltransferase (adenine-specific)